MLHHVLTLLLRLHLAYHVRFKSFGQLQQLRNVTPVNFPIHIDEFLMLQQIGLVLLEQRIKVVVLKHKAKFVREEVIADESHQKDKVINDLLDCRILYPCQNLFKLVLEILPQNIYHNKFKLGSSKLSVSRSSGPTLRLVYTGILLDDADIVDIEG